MQLLDNLTWMRNRAYSPEVKAPRLMFCHIPKTGGMFVHNCLSSALLLQSRLAAAANPGFPGFQAYRIDKPEDKERLNFLSLVASHLPYGWHREYDSSPPFELFTLVRDPFDRVLSGYTYNCMRNGNTPVMEEFLAYAALPENCNNMVRYFSGGELDSPLDVARVLAILNNDFLAFDTMAHITGMIEGLLTHANLPNVMVKGKINFTLDAYKLDASAIRPEIEALNRADAELYAEIEARPRRLPLPDGQRYHPATVLLREVGGSEASLTALQSIGTAQLLDVVARAKNGDEVFSTFFKD